MRNFAAGVRDLSLIGGFIALFISEELAIALLGIGMILVVASLKARSDRRHQELVESMRESGV